MDAFLVLVHDGIHQIPKVPLSPSWWNNAANYAKIFEESLQGPEVAEKAAQVRQKNLLHGEGKNGVNRLYYG